MLMFDSLRFAGSAKSRKDSCTKTIVDAAISKHDGDASSAIPNFGGVSCNGLILGGLENAASE